MKLTALALFFLIFVSSCTVEKRLHNRGWNVQWRKHHKVSNEQSKTSQSAQIKDNQVESESLESTHAVFEPDIQRIQENIRMNKTEEDDLLELTTNFLQEPDDTTKKRVKTVSPAVQNERNKAAEKKSFHRVPRTAEEMRKAGIILIVIGLLLVFVISFVLLYFLMGAAVTFVDVLSGLALSALSVILGFVILFRGSRLLKKSKKSSTE